MRRGAWASVLAVLALAVAGCSEPEQPSTSLPTAVSTSAEPTLEALGPADFPVPEEAREKTNPGAEAAARYYMELAFRTYESLDPTWLRQLSSECAACDEAADGYDADRASGLMYSGGTADVTATFDATDSTGAASVGLLIEQQGFVVTDTTGQVVRDVPARRLTGGVTMSWDATRSAWIVNSRDLAQSG